MTDLDRLTVSMLQMLFNEEIKAREACDFSIEVLKRNVLDAHAADKHRENCLKLDNVLMITGKVREVLDSFRFNGV